MYGLALTDDEAMKAPGAKLDLEVSRMPVGDKRHRAKRDARRRSGEAVH
jgi:hypothetical protein